MRVLIVGCGYVGIALGKALAQRNYQVFGMRRPGAGAAQLQGFGIEPVVADITRPETLEGLSPDYDWVVNCVSASGGGPAAYRSVYFEGTRNLIEWLRAGSLRKFVYTSSTGVYAQDDGSEVAEDSPATGTGETGQVLAATEQVLLDAWRARQFPAIVLRVSGIYGPDRGYWWRQFLSGEARLEGEGERWLNMVHQEDVAGAILAALEKGRPGQVYNVSDNEPVTQRVLFEWLAQRLGRPMPPRGETGSHPPRKRGATHKRISNRRLRLELEYELLYPTFREGFSREMARLQAG